MRGVGNSFAMITNWLFVYVIVLITPTGIYLPSLLILLSSLIIVTAIENIKWRFYIIFAVLNFAWFPIIWYGYIETKGLSLEEVDLMFKIKYNGGKGMTYEEAARLAQAEADIVRHEGKAVRKDDGTHVEQGEFADVKT